MQKYNHRITLKLYGWICLAVDQFVLSIILSTQFNRLWIGGAILCVCVVTYGFIRIQKDKYSGNMSIVSIVVQYVCIFFVLIVEYLCAAEYVVSLLPLLVLGIVCVSELVIVIVIVFLLHKRTKS